jgi:large subunit ribosomal protein L34e
MLFCTARRRVIAFLVNLHFQFLGSVPRCGDTGNKLHGIKAARPHQLKHATKRTKTVSRAYGGVLSAAALRQRIIRSFLASEQKVADKLIKANAAVKK